MPTYLSLNGTSDYLQPPSLSFTKVVLDIEVELKTTWGKYFSYDYKWFQQNSNSGNDQWHTDIQVIKKNGVDQTNLSPFVTIGERAVYTIVLQTSPTKTSYLFANMGAPQTGGKVFDVKYYNGETLKAHYDMNTGTVQDQSGNGNHATLVGGTWVNEGGGGTGTAVNYAYDTTQRFKTTRTINVDSSQKMYTDRLTAYDTENVLYASRSRNADMINQIYAKQTSTYDLQQSIYQRIQSAVDTRIEQYRNVQSDFDSEQQISGIITSVYDTMQEIYSNEIVRTYKYDLSLAIFADKQNVFDTKQEHYGSATTSADLKQAIHKATSTSGDINVIIYENREIHADTLQSVFADRNYGYDTQQSLFDADKTIVRSVSLTGERKLNVYLVGELTNGVNLRSVIQ